MVVKGLRFHADTFAADLGILPPRFFPATVPRQVESIAALLKELGCNLTLVEGDYIDRDYMEDHSAFYARCLEQPTNKCRRAHFFRADREDSYLRDLTRKDVESLSVAKYLGYCVLRPLRSAPVGRTAITPARPDDHPCLREYRAHVHGVELTVQSLVFQQQDRAVSACATTALWSSLSRLESMERMAALSPAAITTMAAASHGAGRVFPSDGLSIEQICRVIHAVGASPVVIECETDLNTFLSYCDGALQSKLAPILLISRGEGADEVWHAITAVGSRSRRRAIPPRKKEQPPMIFDESRALGLLSVHDDRLGPFIPAGISAHPDGGCGLDLGPGEENWRVRNIVVPTYHKVRFSLPELMAVEVKISELLKRERPIGGCAIFRSRMLRQLTEYHRDMHKHASPTLHHVPFSRYVGIVRLRIESDETDVVFDTTTAPGDPRHITIEAHGTTNPDGDALRSWLRGKIDVDGAG